MQFFSRLMKCCPSLLMRNSLRHTFYIANYVVDLLPVNLFSWKMFLQMFLFCAIYLSSLLLPRPNFLRHVAAIKFNMSSNFCYNKLSQFNHLIGFLCSVKKYGFIRFANNCILFYYTASQIWGNLGCNITCSLKYHNSKCSLIQYILYFTS